MKTYRAKPPSSRWSPCASSRTIDALSLDSRKTTAAKRGTQPRLKVLFDIENDVWNDSDSKDEGVYHDNTHATLAVCCPRPKHIERRWSQGDENFDLGNCCPGFVERLMELVYRQIHENSQDTNDGMALEKFSQVSVIGAAVALTVSPKNPFSTDIVKDIASDFPTLNSRTMRKYASFDTLLCRRYAEFVAYSDWVLLIILSYSQTFRYAALSLLPDCWAAFIACIKDNAVSLEVFGRVRGLDIKTSLKRIASNLPSAMRLDLLVLQGKKPEIKSGSPYAYVVAEKMELVEQPMFEGHEQIDIDRNVYKASVFSQGGRPQYWPADKIWPSDPTIRTSGIGICRSCESRTMCDCDPVSCSGVYCPLVELRHFGSKGKGIRTLQRIRKGDILGEYVCLITQAHNQDDPVYGMCITPYKDNSHHDIGLISAKRWGNWTRYINHSCNASTKFAEMIIGSRQRIMVQARRDINIFEELTVNYGDDYWRGKYCECGESCCKLSFHYAVEHCLAGVMQRAST